jgi:hypothetical protein
MVRITLIPDTYSRDHGSLRLDDKMYICTPWGPRTAPALLVKCRSGEVLQWMPTAGRAPAFYIAAWVDRWGRYRRLLRLTAKCQVCKPAGRWVVATMWELWWEDFVQWGTALMGSIPCSMRCWGRDEVGAVGSCCRTGCGSGRPLGWTTWGRPFCILIAPCRFRKEAE